MEFGERISKLFVDALETGHDTRALINLHNNEVGRLVSQILKIIIVLVAVIIIKTIMSILETDSLVDCSGPPLCLCQSSTVLFAWGKKKPQLESDHKPEHEELQ